MPNVNRSHLSPSLSPSPSPLTLLHTSDWHLGRRLYGQMRYEEFEAFLAWLEATIRRYQVDVLIVAGDIFDTMTPSNRAQALYYAFLGHVSKSCCQHIVIVAGNHDSPTFLDAPSHVLKFLNVHVVGTACDNLADEVLVLDDTAGNPFCIITAVPYLRDRDVRSSRAGESAEDKDANVIGGIKAHYDAVADIAQAAQRQLQARVTRHIPIIATGHLFTTNAQTTADDGVRSLYVGNLGNVSADMFADCFDYVALGHLHVPQKVGGREYIRYSGSPIAMGFGEARQQKQVLLVQFAACLLLPEVAEVANIDLAEADLVSDAGDDRGNKQTSASPLAPSNLAKKSAKTVKPVKSLKRDGDGFMDDLFADLDESKDETIENSGSVDTYGTNNRDEIHTIDNRGLKSMAQATILHSDAAKQMHVVSVAVPCFHKLLQIKGDMAHIEQTINALAKDAVIWLEVIYEGSKIVSNLNEVIQALLENTPFKALKIKNTNNYNKVLTSENSTETLQDLNVMEVFERCMIVHDIAESQKDELRAAYEQIVYDIRHEDVNSGRV